MDTPDQEPPAVVRALKRLWSLIHGYDDIRGSRRESSFPLDPTPEELEKARAIRERRAAQE